MENAKAVAKTPKKNICLSVFCLNFPGGFGILFPELGKITDLDPYAC
jgi:hypothetical protein